MNTKDIKVGSLVRRLELDSWPKIIVDTESVGVVVSGPEPFGFIDRCLVFWSGTRPFVDNPCWLNVEDLEVISDESR